MNSVFTRLTKYYFVLMLSCCVKMSVHAAVFLSTASDNSSVTEEVISDGDGQGNIVNICPPPNNQPCGAQFIPLGTVATGSNVCADAVGEPPNVAQCNVLAAILVTTVWYKAVVPASGAVSVRTHPVSLLNTQIEGFLFPGGCANAVANNTSLGCNDTGHACLVNDIGYHTFSELFFSNLTPGDTVYVAVDGVGSLTGTFDISFKDGAIANYPPVYQQDCELPQQICSSDSLVVPDPGFRNTGNICDLTSGISCWGIGERNSVWYQFTVDPSLTGGTASISFDILSLPTTDIDFMLWNVTGMTNACQAIQTFSILPDACNFYTTSAMTGLSPLGLGVGYPYSPSLQVSGGPQTFLMLLNDFNSAGTAGYKIKWGTTPLTSNATTVWTGTTDSLFTTGTNWGNCGSPPSCSTDATIVNTANGRQPIVTAGVKSVGNLVIKPGAKLTLLTGAILQVCGNFTNNGSLVCNPGSTIKFIGAANQTISGSLTGSNAFANLTVLKSGGNVQLLSNIDVSQNFTTASFATSIFNINGKYMKVGGDFSNFSGNTTFTGTNFSTVEFYLSVNQNFTNNNGSLVLHKVVMNKPSGDLILTGANSTMNIDSTLKLISGRIVTRSSPLLEVNVTLFQPTAVFGHNLNSYIDGVLRRKISNGASAVTGSWDFPVGNSSMPGGYENVTIQFQTSTTIPDIKATFTGWNSATPPTKGPLASECISASYAVLPIFDNGYWTILRSSAGIYNGNYTMTLHNTGVLNNSGLGWTVTSSDTASDPNMIASWILQGNCVITSTPANTSRTNINPLPTLSATSFNRFYTTAQTGTTLPVELLFFTAEQKGNSVVCSWETASETNNDYFEVERSIDGSVFETIGKVNGYGAGTSTVNIKYSLTDEDPCDAIRYYRLKQTDIDGRYSYSDVAVVNCILKKDFFNVYPNPAGSVIFCTFFESHDGSVKLQWHDVLGKITKEETHAVQKGFNTIQSDVSDLAKGIYYLQIREDEKHQDVNIRKVKFLMN